MDTITGYKDRALASLKGTWGGAVVLTLVYGIIATIARCIPYIGTLVSILILPLEFGLAVAFLYVARGQKCEFDPLFEGFKGYGRILGTTLLKVVYCILWSLLLIVPGIIKSYSYAMTYYVLRDEPELSYNGAIEKSMALMDGNKMKLFLLDLSFIGWYILSCITLGIGLLWLVPYVKTAHAHFYEDLVKEKAA